MLITEKISSNDIKRLWKLSLQMPVKREEAQSRNIAKHTDRCIVLHRRPL